MEAQAAGHPSWHDLDYALKLEVLSRLPLKDLCAIAPVCKELHELSLQAHAWLPLLQKQYGIKLQGCQEPGAAKALYQLLVQRGVGSPLDAPSKCYPIRFQACFTDGGVDEEKFERYWADLAFECNGWGAYCSKISPNVNVLGLLQMRNEEELELVARRAWLADRCRWAAGRLLARVPLPLRGEPLTQRQVRFFAKAHASLLRWPTQALERLFCMLWELRAQGKALGHTLDLHWPAQASPAPPSGALPADAPLPWLAGLEATQGPGNGGGGASTSKAGPSGAAAAGGKEGSSKGKKQGKAKSKGKGAQQEQQAAQEAREVPEEEMKAVLGRVYNWVLENNGWKPLLGSPLPELGQQPAAGSGMGGVANGLDVSQLHVDPGKLRIFHRGLAQRLGQPQVLGSHVAVVDAVAVNRAGNFTCPLRCGAVFMGCLGAGSPAASQPGSAEGDAAMQEHLAAIAQQPWSKALDDAMTSEDVIHAVQEGKLPKILRHQLLPVGEFIEFEPAPAPGASAGSSGRPPVAMRPVIWFRHFTDQEQELLSASYRALPPLDPDLGRHRAGDDEQHPWGKLTVKELQDFEMKLWGQQQQADQDGDQQLLQRPPQEKGTGRQEQAAQARQQEKEEQQGQAALEGAGAGKSGVLERRYAMAKRMVCKAKAEKTAAGRMQAALPARKRKLTAAEKASLKAPETLTSMGADGKLREVSAQGCMAAPQSLQACAWGNMLFQSQESVLMQRREAAAAAAAGGAGGGAGAGGWAPGMGGGHSSSDEEDESQEDDEEDAELMLNELIGDGGPMDFQGPENVEELMQMMGYHPPPGAAGAGAGAAGAGQAQGGAAAGGGEGNSSDEDDDEEDLGASDSSSEGEGGSSSGDGEGSDDGHGDMDAQEQAELMALDEEEEQAMALEFPDLIDDGQPTVEERQAVHTLVQLVGMQPLTQSHLELENEAALIIEEEDAMRDGRHRGRRHHLAGATSVLQQQQQGLVGGRVRVRGASGLEVQILPGDDTGVDATAFQPAITFRDYTRYPGLLKAALTKPRATNAVVIKMIAPEDRMEEMEDMHDAPNIDVQFVALRGVALKLPNSMCLQGS